MRNWVPRARRAAQAAVTAWGGRARGFFIPYRYADAVAALDHYAALMPLFRQAEPEFRALLSAAAGQLGALQALGEEKPPAPRWTQDWFPRLDAAIAYTLVRTRAPRRIVEIGSGHSTRFMMRAVQDGGLTTRFTSIDPAPRATLDGLAIEPLRIRVQDAPDTAFALRAGDILFIDSSHILMPGSDVDVLLNSVLPRLDAGVLVHIHDIFLPDGYPAGWAWRGYNEQNAVASLLEKYRLLWSSHHVARHMAASVEAAGLAALPLVPGAHETSLWLVKS